MNNWKLSQGTSVRTDKCCVSAHTWSLHSDLDVAAVLWSMWVHQRTNTAVCFETQLEFEREPEICFSEQKQLERLRLKGRYPFCSLVIQLRLFSLHSFFVFVFVWAPTHIKAEYALQSPYRQPLLSKLKAVYVPNDYTSFQSSCVNICSEKWEPEIRFKATTKAMSSIHVCAWEGCVWMCAAVCVCVHRMSMLF